MSQVETASAKTPTYTVIVWVGSMFLQYLPPRQSCYLGHRGYVFIFYCNSARMSSWGREASLCRLRSTGNGGDEGHLVAGRRSGIQRVDQARAWHKPGRNRGDVEFGRQEPEVLIGGGGGRSHVLSPWWASRRLGLRGQDVAV